MSVFKDVKNVTRHKSVVHEHVLHNAKTTHYMHYYFQISELQNCMTYTRNHSSYKIKYMHDKEIFINFPP